MDVDRFASEIHRVGGVKFGNFKLKSGAFSPVYVDLRVLVSYPGVLRMAGEALGTVLSRLEFDRIAGLPYAGLPLAVSASLQGDWPMLYARKEPKEYGTGQRVEGAFEPGQTVALIDDVVTTGGAKLELVTPFLEAGLRVRDVVVLVDREQGGAEVLRQAGYRLHAVFTLRAVLESLRRAGEISETVYNTVMEYLDRTRP